MNITLSGILGSVALLVASSQASADEESRLSAELEMEIGIESVIDSDDPDEEYNDIYVSTEASFEYELSDTLTAFLGVSLESVTDADGNRAFENLGVYVSELGLSLDFDAAKLTFGKFAPSFGSANDSVPGYFGGEFADDYEFEEALGVAAEIEIGQGTLNAAAFYADDTSLSDSWGTKRGRNDTESGGVGNTGTLNNFALQYDLELEQSTFHAGLRHLSKGKGDFYDEQGVALGMTHTIADGVEIMAEMAHFSGFEGSENDARFGIVGLSFETDSASYSASVSRRDIDNVGVDLAYTLGLDVDITDTTSFTAGYAFVEEEGVASHKMGLAMVFQLGG